MPKRKAKKQRSVKQSRNESDDDGDSGGEISFFNEEEEDVELNNGYDDNNYGVHEVSHQNGHDNEEEEEDDANEDDKPNGKSDESGEKIVLLPQTSLLSQIKNKIRRRELYEKYKKEKKEEKKKVRKARTDLAKALGDKAPPKQVPRTIESTREPDDTMVDPDDEEVKIDESLDEMSSYFKREREPKVLITSTDNPHTKTIKFCRELKQTIPNAEFRWRNRSSVKKMVTAAIERDYSDIVIINEDWRKPNGMLLIHLPDGPTAHFKMSSVKFCKDIKNRASYSAHRPEVILNHFNTRLGHTIGRMFASVFHYDPQFHGRRVATFHNQRDYIFFRHHRYEFKNAEKVAIQEMGPRFTLKLRSLQRGTFDAKFGEYEWALKRHEMTTSRRRFFL